MKNRKADFMDLNNLKIVLASKSPRRCELLRYITENFEVLPSENQENLPDGIQPCEAPEFLAAQKALDVLKKRPDSLIIGCDTIVLIDGRILGKPHSEDEAYEMLSTLSGRVHTVISGVCLCYKGKTLSFSQKTAVEFYPLSPDEILDYIHSCKPFDKAGSYGIQDKGGLFVKEITGDFYNVVGFPVPRLARELKKFLNMI